MEYGYEITEKIRKGEVSLFVGAGMSMLAGLPSGNVLLERLKNKFNLCDQSLSDIMSFCEDVVDTPPYNKVELENFIKEQLAHFKPSDYHHKLTQFNWASIFTTNYDNVIEVAYNVAEGVSRRCNAVYQSKPMSYNLHDSTVVNLFKIMGCVNATPEDGGMVLSNTDFGITGAKRSSYLNILFDSVRNGNIIYLGYSFRDKIAVSIIKEVKNIIGENRLPWSYMFSLEPIPTDQKTQYFFQTHKIIPIQLSIEDFFDYLEKESVTTSDDKHSFESITSLKINNKIVQIPSKDFRSISDQFSILNEENTSSFKGEKDDFLMGLVSDWGAFGNDWDFIRSEYSSILYNVRNELANISNSNSIYKISGMPGAGKTFLLKRLAYDLYKEEQRPVFYYNGLGKFDFRAIASSIESINKEYDTLFDEGAKIPQLKYVLFFDDAALNLLDIIRLKDYLVSRGRQILIFVCDRENEWLKSSNEFNYKFKESFTINEQLEAEEFENLINYLFDNKYIAVKNDYVREKIKRDSEDSFFAIIYSHVNPARKPLNEIIKDQYNGLHGLSKKAYEYICCFSQFNIPINIEWVVRILGCSYQEFIDEVLKINAAKIIFEQTDSQGNVLYTTHHRIIAKKTIDYFLPDSKILYDKYLEILENVELSHNIENQICADFLIRNFSINGSNPNNFGIAQRVELFKACLHKNETRTIYHHLGLLEIENGNFEDAEEYLEAALAIEDFGYGRGESDQNILTSLGKLYTRHAFSFPKNSEESDEILNLYEQAERFFDLAKHGEYPNDHAYHSHAHLWYKRGNEKKDDSEKVFYFTNALEILQTAKDNLNKDDIQPLYELEQMIWSALGAEDKIDTISDLLKTRYNSAKGYYLSALYYFKLAQDENGEERIRLLKNAYRKITKGLRSFNDDEGCLELRCKIYKELPSFEDEEYFSYLEKWHQKSSRPNAFLLYEYARMAFCLEFYDLSERMFDELQSGVGNGNNMRAKQKDPIREDGKIKSFTGKITDIFNPKEGYIQFQTFRQNHKIKFSPISANYTVRRGDNVNFEIFFAFRGPLAMNIRKL